MNKIKVAIFDDESRICRLIERLIDWESLGLELVGIAHDGIEALKTIETLEPDIVITDIRMPGYEGIELIERSRQLDKRHEFIIISGYSDFEYTKSAIKFGVNDYILKPIKKDELNLALSNLVNKINETKTDSVDGFVKEVFKNYGNIESYEISKPSIKSQEKFLFAYIKNKEKFKGLEFDYCFMDGNTVLVLTDKLSINKLVDVVLKNNPNSYIYYKEIKLEELQEYVIMAKATHNNRFTLSEGRLHEIVTLEKNLNNDKITWDLLIKDQNMEGLCSFVESNLNHENAASTLETLIQSFIYYAYPQTFIFQLQEIFELSDSLDEVTSRLQSLFSNYEIDEDKMGIAKRYIKQFCHDDLSLDRVSSYLNLSPNYFSTLFRKETGTSFSAYLIKARVEKARHLLLTSKDSISAICTAVGYSDQKYFTRVFNETTGLTPAAYRREYSKL